MGFHTIITLAYLIPGIYVFIRVWQLFIPGSRAWLYIFIYALLYAIYPVSRRFEGSDMFFAGLIESTSGYLIAFFLYLFLSVLVTDILLLLNLIFRFIDKEKLRNRKLRNRYFAAILLVSVLVTVGGIINFNTIRESDYSISVSAGRSDMKSLRIAFVSDFHLERTVPERFVRKFARKLNDLEPDIILYGGDIIEGSGENIHDFEKMLGSVHSKFGAYGVRGNHDRLRRFDDNFFTRAGIDLLRDSVVIICNGYAIAGRDEAGNRNRLSADEIASRAPEDLPLIMLDHRPTEPDQISRTKAAISFSGHTHDGQLFPINLYLHRIYQLSHGYMKKADTWFFVSSGIRLWGPRVRTTGRSEIIIVDVEFI